MENDSDNVITLVQPKSEEEKLLNVVITDKKSSGKNIANTIKRRYQKQIARLSAVNVARC
jgi:hypothetical protein